MLGQPSEILDVFLFNDEEAPLLARYLELKEVVTRFVAIEGDLTSAGKPRAPRFWKTIENLKLDPKYFELISITLPQQASPHDRERVQRDQALDYLRETYPPNTIVIFSDVDEIPRLEALQSAIPRVQESGEVAFFAQWMCVGWLNNREKSRRLLSFAGEFPEISKRNAKWLGTTMTVLQTLLNGMTLSELRHPETKTVGFRVEDAGWHFSYCGGSLTSTPEERIANKLRDSAHTEFQHLIKMAEKIVRRLDRGRDLLGRRFVRFELVEPQTFLSHRFSQEPRLQHLMRWQ
jgi:hypothetical protein